MAKPVDDFVLWPILTRIILREIFWFTQILWTLTMLVST